MGSVTGYSKAKVDELVSARYAKPGGGIPLSDMKVADLDGRFAAAGLTAKKPVQLTNNCCTISLNNTVTAQGTYEEMHVVGVAGNNIQLVFSLAYGDGSTTNVDHDPTTSITFSASLKDAAGNNYQVLFKGQNSYQLNGGGTVTCDPLPIALAVGDVIYVRVYLNTGTAYTNKSTAVSWIGSQYGGFTATTNLTPTGSGAVGAGSGAAWGPVAIVGTPTGTGKPKSLAVFGDSIAYGLADGLYGGIAAGWWGPDYLMLSGGGPFMRALSGQAGILMQAFSGDSAKQFVTGLGHFRRGAFTKYTTFGLIEYGSNDLSLGRTVAQLQADNLTIAKMGIEQGQYGSFITTILPRGTSTDAWKTVANQTPDAMNTNRVAYNGWVRAGCPIVNGVAVAVGTSGALLAGQPGHPILGTIDIARAVESAQDSGKWKAPLLVVTDAAITSGQLTLNSASANFTTAAHKGLDVYVPGAGAAGAALKTRILAVNSTTQVTVDTAAGTTVTGANALIGVYTFDGAHPGCYANAQIAADIQTPLFGLMV